MLLLIENDEDIALEKVDNNYLKQPELIARVKEISERHHLLADHYNKLTGELSGHLKSANEWKNDQNSNFSSQLTPPFRTPANKLWMQKESQVVAFDISPSSGDGTAPGSESSVFSSDSDSESYKSSHNERSSSFPSGKMPKHETYVAEQEETHDTIKVGEHGEYEILQTRISEYEKELKVSNEKLQSAEEEIAKLRSELQNNETVMVEMGRIETQLLSAKNQIKLHESELEKENKRSLMLQRQIVDLESNLEAEKRQVHELQESVKGYKTELSDRDLDIQKLNAELQDVSANFALEKWQLESCVSELSENLIFQEERTNKLQVQCESLTNQMEKCEAGKVEMEIKLEALRISWLDEIERAKAELSKNNEVINTLNKNLDGLKLNHDMLMAEKDEVNAKLQTLSANLTSRDNEIQRLGHNLHELYSENKRLIAGSDSANKLTSELKSRIEELEKEVEMQGMMISSTAEEKREAIRQLCFSLDHFRCAYVELREACVMRKRQITVVS